MIGTCLACSQVDLLPDAVYCARCDDALFALVAGETYPTQDDRAIEAFLAQEWEARYA